MGCRICKSDFPWSHLCFLYASMLGISLSHQKSPDPTLLCRTSRDLVHNGTNLDCSNCGLASDEISELNFPNVTTLILNRNNIGTLQNKSFVHFRGILKQLECIFCNLKILESDTLKGLESLEVLVLSHNFLRIIDHAFPLGFFYHVPHLKTLKIEHNGNVGLASNYSGYIDIFDSLPRVTNLAIDSFSNLRIGAEFTKLRNLTTLNVICSNTEAILEDSLEGFQDSNVKHFGLFQGNVFQNEANPMVFQYLPNVSSLIMNHMMLGNLNTMRMMQPLQGRQIDEIYLDRVNLKHSSEIHRKIDDLVLTAKATEYLTEICVSHFRWNNNGIIALGSDAFISKRWYGCLKSLTFITGSSYLNIDSVYLFKMEQFRNLKSFIYMKRPSSIGFDFWDQSTSNEIDMSEKLMQDDNHMFELQRLFQRRLVLRRDTDNATYYRHDPLGSTTNVKPLTPHHHSIMHLKTISFLNLHYNSSCELKTKRTSRMAVRTPRSSVIISIPIHLQTIVIDDAGSQLLNMDFSIRKNDLRIVYLRNYHTNGVYLGGRLMGLNKVTTIDFTNTQLSGKPTFFKWFPSLNRLVLRNTKQNSEFYLQIADNVPGMIYYDIAENQLHRLPVKMFRLNKQLKFLCLASNRFSGIPWNLKLTPNLEILDLRRNSLVELSLQEREAIDDLVSRVPNLTFLLSENPFSCTCSALPFLKWLFNSKARFNQGGNYSCMAEDGTLSFTGFYGDTASLWRQCQGRFYFLISLVLAAILVAFYTIVFLLIKHKTQILSKVRQIVVPGFRMKTRQDFAYDVFVGYADQDVDFVRNVLLRYLENMWQLKTFVHQRDLLQDPLLMSHALRDSWRSVLLITENFLHGYAMAHNVMKTATFFVTPGNPSSVIVMVEERVQYQIPDYVFQVVDEDNIIVLPGLEDFLEYEAKETLKTRIL